MLCFCWYSTTIPLYNKIHSWFTQRRQQHKKQREKYRKNHGRCKLFMTLFLGHFTMEWTNLFHFFCLTLEAFNFVVYLFHARGELWIVQHPHPSVFQRFSSRGAYNHFIETSRVGLEHEKILLISLLSLDFGGVGPFLWGKQWNFLMIGSNHSGRAAANEKNE